MPIIIGKLSKTDMSKTGFSLIELLAVIVIVGILAAIAFPIFKMYQVRSKLSKNVVILQNIVEQAVFYAQKNGRFPNRSQLDLPSNPNTGSYSQNASIWGGNNGASWGDGCGRSGFYEIIIDPTAIGLPDVINFGVGCNIYNINKVIRKLCYYWQQTASGYVYGQIAIPGFVNQFENGNSTAFLAMHQALYDSSSCN